MENVDKFFKNIKIPIKAPGGNEGEKIIGNALAYKRPAISDNRKKYLLCFIMQIPSV